MRIDKLKKHLGSAFIGAGIALGLVGAVCVGIGAVTMLTTAFTAGLTLQFALATLGVALGASGADDGVKLARRGYDMAFGAPDPSSKSQLNLKTAVLSGVATLALITGIGQLGAKAVNRIFNTAADGSPRAELVVNDFAADRHGGVKSKSTGLLFGERI